MPCKCCLDKKKIRVLLVFHEVSVKDVKKDLRNLKKDKVICGELFWLNCSKNEA